jgi:hypothetical protein
MATDPIKKTYIHTAHGYGFSARIDRPFEHLVDVHAGSTLPTTGGFETSRTENFRLKEIISYRAAYSVVGSSRNPKDDTYNSSVTATIEGLNILDMVTADRIVARVTSKQRLDEEEPTILSIGSRFENLRIAGCPVQVDLDNELFTRLGTYAAFKQEYTENQQSREMMQGRFLWGKPKADVPEFLRERYNWFASDDFPESKGIVLCSLVKDVKTTCSELRRYGNVIVVPHFGKIYLAEFQLQRHERELAMLRVELGSAVGGGAGGPGGTGGGTTFP